VTLPKRSRAETDVEMSHETSRAPAIALCDEPLEAADATVITRHCRDQQLLVELAI
jgi:hypothetical protein